MSFLIEIKKKSGIMYSLLTYHPTALNVTPPPPKKQLPILSQTNKYCY